ncbi:MAG: transcriptional repressor [Muribaculaceae bacterium]|nr:transcriptional repressor [Muribaculaceae bacterium]
MNRTAQHLVSHNIKPSAQRIAIMKYLMEHPTHPSVDKIYCDLLPDMPTLSRTTVYNTLRVLEENDALITLNIDSKNVRYDGNVMPHAHFMCRSCGKIYDTALPEGILKEIPGMETFQIDAIKLYYKGLCQECQEKENNNKE